MGQGADIGARPSERLTWALCVSTCDRPDMLELCVRHALGSTRMPSEIVICDASAGWEGHHARIAPLAEAAGVPLHYLPAPKKSLPAQRNHAIGAARADILFLIDDDAFLHPDCAEVIMQVYETDRDRRIAAVSASDGPLPEATPLAGGKGGASRAPLTERLLRSSFLMRFLWTEVLLMSAERMFIPYDGTWHKPTEEEVAAYSSSALFPVSLISGYRLTVRRSIALDEPFDGDLLAYASAEDLDATYRFSRHGWNVVAVEGRIYHHEALPGRLKRQQSSRLSVLNIAFFLRKHAGRPLRRSVDFGVMVARRLLAEVLKDGLSRRWLFPQLRGVAAAIPDSIRILLHDRATLAPFYDSIQRKVLGLPPAAATLTARARSVPPRSDFTPRA
ncbi:glycosyltransferase family 2 protein [Rhodobacter calidifons]|uniref:Glycosyltransferase n=1 Tax=Rhodobacter calidifons TaxID=2715277 RepID=A0ABX0G3K9_9RHOB|nr:glycosyltransferase family 2 protein [Rhodobacter calidifons]NHB75449.1 glycosyltransferase [Rhodobacter calidifons]